MSMPCGTIDFRDNMGVSTVVLCFLALTCSYYFCMSYIQGLLLDLVELSAFGNYYEPCCDYKVTFAYSKC